MRRIICGIPVLLLLVGGAIHLAAIGGYKLDSEPVWTDWLFLAIDLVLAAVLLMRLRWGYWAAVGLFAEQLVVQGYWAVRVVAATDSVVGRQQLAAAACALSLAILLANRAAFTASRRRTLRERSSRP